jgi:NAD-dependent DNA ligase
MNNLPTYCPACGSTLEWSENNVDLVCVDTLRCSAQQIMIVESFVKKLGIENASAKSLKKWGISTMQDLLTFVPNGKNANKFYDAMKDKMFNQSKFEILSCMYYNGSGRKSMMKIFEHYTLSELDNMFSNPMLIMAPYPEGFQEKSITNMLQTWGDNITFIYKLMDDERWVEQFDDSYDKMEAAPTSSNICEGMVFCFTGALSSMSRPEAQKKVTANGGQFATSVTKKVTHLVTADPTKLTTKLKKAQSNGVIIMSELEFNKLVNN